HVHPFHSIKYLREMILPNIEQGAKKAGRSRSDCKLSSAVFIIAGDTAEERNAMKDRVKQQMAFYASTPAYRPVLEAHGWGDLQQKLNDMTRSGDWAGMANLITDEMLDVYATSGAWEEIPGKIKQRYEGILDRAAFYAPVRAGDRPERWREIVR